MNRIKTITVQRVKNLGDYESERLELTVELDPHRIISEEDEDERVIELRDRVHRLLNQSLPKKSPAVIETFSDYSDL
jgi:GTPase Era involved in 16S rRNA processing